MKSLNILITSGGCEEAVDRVRSLCNFSTGATAARICEELYERGHRINLLKGKRALSPNCPCIDADPSLVDKAGTDNRAVVVESFTAYDDLKAKLQNLAGRPFDCVIFNAAVSDYGVDRVEQGTERYRPEDLEKLPSSEDRPLRIILKPHKKLIDSLHTLFGEACRILGFKLTCNASSEERREAVEALFRHAPAEAVLSNDLSEIVGEEHGFTLWSRSGSLLQQGKTKEDLARAVRLWAEQAL